MDAKLQNTGIILLAGAIRRAFPQAKWVNSGTKGPSFFCDVYFPTPYDLKITTEVVQQALRDLFDQVTTWTTKEMLWGNAQAYIKHAHGLWPLLDENLDGRELVVLGEINGKPIVAPGEVVEDFSEIEACRVWDVHPLLTEAAPFEKMETVRFWGFAVSDKKDLSYLQKQLVKAKKEDPTQLGAAQGLFLPPDNPQQRWVWFPKGHAWRRDLLDWIRDVAQISEVEGFAAIEPDEIEEEMLAQHLVCLAAAIKKGQSLPQAFGQTLQVTQPPVPFGNNNGLFDSFFQTSYQAHAFYSETNSQEGVISSLQRIEKTYKMLGIEHYWVFRLAKPKGVLEPVIWNTKKRSLETALQTCGLTGEILPSVERQTGPQAQLIATDTYGQPWVLASVTLDAENQPVVDEYMQYNIRGFKQKVAVIHISLMESLERLTAFLLREKMHLPLLSDEGKQALRGR